MARTTQVTRIQFDEPATIDELFEPSPSCAKVGGDATPRVRVKPALHADGGHVVRITA